MAHDLTRLNGLFPLAPAWSPPKQPRLLTRQLTRISGFGELTKEAISQSSDIYRHACFETVKTLICVRDLHDAGRLSDNEDRALEPILRAYHQHVMNVLNASDEEIEVQLAEGCRRLRDGGQLVDIVADLLDNWRR